LSEDEMGAWERMLAAEHVLRKDWDNEHDEFGITHNRFYAHLY